jgi:predicted lipase
MTIIDHETVIDMLYNTKLIYNYNEDTRYKKIEYRTLHIEDVLVNNTFTEKCKCLASGQIIQIITDEITDVQVGITADDSNKRICVMFRGTKTPTSWYYNLQSNKQCVGKHISLHKGFCKQLFATNLYYKILNVLNKQIIANPEYELFVTGHSAGGALATLFGYFLSTELQDKQDKQIRIVSFASPRIGNYEFKQDFESRMNLIHYRVTNQQDIIPFIPFYKYHHVGHKISIRTNPKRVWCCWHEHLTESYYTSLLDTTW